MNHQFISRNQSELLNVIIRFRELTHIYQDFLTLYLEKDFWEIFDMRVGRTIFRHRFKHVSALLENIRRLEHAILEVGCIKYRIDGKPSKVQSNCIKFLQTLYKPSEIIYFYGKR